MCYLKTSSDCYNDMLRFLRVLEIPDFKMSEEYIKESILKKVQEKVSKTKVTSIRLQDQLSSEHEKVIL